jgi:hypothetical protein
MKKTSIFLGIISAILICSCGDLSVNLIGKSREEVISLLGSSAHYRYKDLGGVKNKIRISVNSVNKYYNSIDEIKNSPFIMKSDTWEIMYRKTFFGEKFIEITFDANGFVVLQRNRALRDGP